MLSLNMALAYALFVHTLFRSTDVRGVPVTERSSSSGTKQLNHSTTVQSAQEPSGWCWRIVVNQPPCQRALFPSSLPFLTDRVTQLSCQHPHARTHTLKAVSCHSLRAGASMPQGSEARDKTPDQPSGLHILLCNCSLVSSPNYYWPL